MDKIPQSGGPAPTAQTGATSGVSKNVFQRLGQRMQDVGKKSTPAVKQEIAKATVTEDGHLSINGKLYQVTFTDKDGKRLQPPKNQAEVLKTMAEVINLSGKDLKTHTPTSINMAKGKSGVTFRGANKETVTRSFSRPAFSSRQRAGNKAMKQLQTLAKGAFEAPVRPARPASSPTPPPAQTKPTEQRAKAPTPAPRKAPMGKPIPAPRPDVKQSERAPPPASSAPIAADKEKEMKAMQVSRPTGEHASAARKDRKMTSSDLEVSMTRTQNATFGSHSILRDYSSEAGESVKQGFQEAAGRKKIPFGHRRAAKAALKHLDTLNDVCGKLAQDKQFKDCYSDDSQVASKTVGPGDKVVKDSITLTDQQKSDLTKAKGRLEASLAKLKKAAKAFPEGRKLLELSTEARLANSVVLGTEAATKSVLREVNELLAASEHKPVIDDASSRTDTESSESVQPTTEEVAPATELTQEQAAVVDSLASIAYESVEWDGTLSEEHGGWYGEDADGQLWFKNEEGDVWREDAAGGDWIAFVPRESESAADPVENEAVAGAPPPPPPPPVVTGSEVNAGATLQDQLKAQQSRLKKTEGPLTNAPAEPSEDASLGNSKQTDSMIKKARRGEDSTVESDDDDWDD